MKVNMHDAKSQLSKLGEAAWRGEKVIIAKAGKPYLDLIPHHSGRTNRRVPGRYAGKIKLADDFDTTPAAVISAFEDD